METTTQKPTENGPTGLVALWRFVRRLWARSPDAPALSEKLLVQLGDGRCALADNDDHAQAIVMNECLRSGGMVSANFRPATVDEVAALSSPNVAVRDAEDRP